MTLGLVGFATEIAEMIDKQTTESGHFCMVFASPSNLVDMIRDEVELPCFDALIFDSSDNPRTTRFSLGLITPLRGQLYRELCVLNNTQATDFWRILEPDVDQWLSRLEDWRPPTEVFYLFGQIPPTTND